MAKLDLSQRQPIGKLQHGHNTHGRGQISPLAPSRSYRRNLMPTGPALATVSPPPPSYIHTEPIPGVLGIWVPPGPIAPNTQMWVYYFLPGGLWAVTMTATGSVHWKYNNSGPPNQAGINADGTQYVNLYNAGTLGYTFGAVIEADGVVGYGTLAGSGYNQTTYEPITIPPIQVIVQP